MYGHLHRKNTTFFFELFCWEMFFSSFSTRETLAFRQTLTVQFQEIIDFQFLALIF